MKLTLEVFIAVLAAKIVYDFIILAVVVEGLRKTFKRKSKTTPQPNVPPQNTNL